jgi:hypothetical protein
MDIDKIKWKFSSWHFYNTGWKEYRGNNETINFLKFLFIFSASGRNFFLPSHVSVGCSEFCAKELRYFYVRGFICVRMSPSVSECFVLLGVNTSFHFDNVFISKCVINDPHIPISCVTLNESGVANWFCALQIFDCHFCHQCTFFFKGSVSCLLWKIVKICCTA